MYSSRQAKILSICLLRDDYITYHEISEQLQMSSRTIMRELPQIKDSLQSFNLDILSKKGKGIRIIGRDEDKQNLIMDIQGSKIDYMDKEERQELLCLELLRMKEIQKLFYYSNKFQVSEATISHDLDDLESFFQQFQIKLVRKPGYGVGIEANETNIRQAISSIINSTVQHHIVNVDFDRYNVQDVMEQILTTQNSNMKKLLDTNILTTILEVFKTHRQELELDSIAKSSYMGLLIHLMIAVSRIQVGEQLHDNHEIFNLIENQKAYQKAQFIVEYLSDAFDIAIEETECAFIAIHLQSAKSAMLNQETSVEEYNDVIIKMLNVFKENGYNLLSDYELYQSLAAHLKPALVRLEYNLPIYNPMLSQIQENFLDIFEITKKACVVLGETYGYEFNNDEIGYLALHFAAAIERYKVSHLRPIQVGVVCSSGIGLSALLIARLKRVVDQNVHLIPLSISDIKHNQCELLISTFDIENAIFVTPLLSQNDVIHVLKAIEERRQTNDSSQLQSTQYDLIALSDMVKLLIQDIQLYIFPHNYNKQELIEKICQMINSNPLLKSQILQREEKGSNIYPEFGFALLHTSTHLVEECLVHVIRSDDNVFIGENLENIKVALFMLIPEHATNAQKRMMSFLSAQLIENKGFFEKLISGTQEEIQNEFHEVLQAWIIQMIKEETNGTY